MPSIELSDEQLNYLRTMLLFAMNDMMKISNDAKVREHLTKIVEIHEALKNAKH